MPRRPTTMFWEAARAQLSIAGFREILQDTCTASATGTGQYTVAEANTRRVVALYAGTGATDIRFEMGTGTTSSMPLLPQRYVTIDAKKDEVIGFYNETSGAKIIYIMEVE